MAAETSALQRDLADACGALAAQKASNKGLQIRVAELLAAGADADALQESCAQLRQERDTLLATKNRWSSNETGAPVNPFRMIRFSTQVLRYG